MEQLIIELNDPVNQGVPDRISALQRTVQQLQREQLAWQTGLEFLRNERDIIRFYGALTLTVKINADWDQDGLAENEELRFELLQGLVNNYVLLTNLGDAAFVLQKICSTLSAFYFKPSSGWERPVRQLATSFELGHFASDEAATSTGLLLETARNLSYYQLRGMVWFCSNLAEEAERLDLGSLKEASLERKATQNSNDVLALYNSLLEEMLLRHEQNDQETSFRQSDAEILHLAKLILERNSSWLDLVRDTFSLDDEDEIRTDVSYEKSVDLLFSVYKIPDIEDDVIQSLGQLMPRWSSRRSRAFKPELTSIITSPHAQDLVSSVVRGEFSSEAHQYIELLMSLVEQEDLTSPEYIDQSCIGIIIPIFQQLMRSEGVPNIDEEFSQRVLEHFSYLAEGYIDWEDRVPYAGQMEGMFLDVCRSCIIRAKFPADEMWSNRLWDPDERTKFRDFRMEVQDYIQTVSACIRGPLMKLIRDTILSTAAQNDYTLFEAGLFCLRALPDTKLGEAERDYDQIRKALSESSSWQRVLSDTQPVPDRARRGVVDLLAEEPEYFRRHLDQLIPSLQFLFSSLLLPHSGNSAARAIEKLCKAHSKILAEGWQQFVGSLSSLSNIAASERHRLLSAVAAVIQGIEPLEGQVEPLQMLLNLIADSIQPPTPSNSNENDETTNLLCLDAMQSLAAIGKGLKSPDTSVNLDSEEQEDIGFWTTGPGHSVQEHAISLCSSILDVPGARTDSDVLSAACDFLKTGYAEQDPSPFRFSPEVSVNFLTSLITTSQSDVEPILATASGFLSSVNPSTLSPDLFSRLVTSTITLSESLLSTSLNTSTTPDPSISTSLLDHWTRLLQKWSQTWLTLPIAPSQLQTTVKFTLHVLSDPDTLPRRYAATYLSALLDLSSAPTPLSQETLSLLTTTLTPNLPTITATLLHLIAGVCARSEIEPFVSPLRNLLIKQGLSARRLLREAIKAESGVLSATAIQQTALEERVRFVSMLEGLTRGGGTGGSRGRMVEVVREFWGACRSGGGGRWGYVS